MQIRRISARPQAKPKSIQHCGGSSPPSHQQASESPDFLCPANFPVDLLAIKMLRVDIFTAQHEWVAVSFNQQLLFDFHNWALKSSARVVLSNILIKNLIVPWCFAF
jgi:hypothetical protein